MQTLVQVEPALKLRRALDGGALFTRWAEQACGQAVTADVQRENPPCLWGHEADSLGMAPAESWAALRRAGRLVQADGTEVARVTSVVAIGRLDHQTVLTLTTTSTPLGTALGPGAHRKVLECSVGIGEFAVHCWSVVLRGDVAVALATERVRWSWLQGLPGSTWG